MLYNKYVRITLENDPINKGAHTRLGHGLDQIRIPTQGILELNGRDAGRGRHIFGIVVVFLTSEDRFVNRINCSEHSDDFHVSLNVIVNNFDLLLNLIEREGSSTRRDLQAIIYEKG